MDPIKHLEAIHGKNVNFIYLDFDLPLLDFFFRLRSAL